MTVRSSPSAPTTGWDRLQGLLDDFRAEQTQTEHFLAGMLDHLTQAVSASIEDDPPRQASQPDPRVDQLIASAELHRAAVDELLELARQRTAAEQALQKSILHAIREERAAAAQTVTETVDAAVSGAVEKVIAHSLEQQACLVANSLAEHRSMMTMAAEAMRRAAGGAPEERNDTSRTGTEASPTAGAAQDSRAAPAADAVLDSIRVQFEILQRQTARRRQANPESRS